MTTAVLPPPAPSGPLSPSPDSPSPQPRASATTPAHTTTPTPSQTLPATATATRDPVFWTELEIRRLGNLIAASIEARAFVGISAAAAAERAQMRVYLDAMKRKAFRVLERAERFAHSPEHEWPGLDPTVADPVALADEYVKVVQDYLAVLAAEEDAAAVAAADAADAADVADAVPGGPADDDDDDGDDALSPGAAEQGSADEEALAKKGDDDDDDSQKQPNAAEDGVAADDQAYREALEREHEALEAGRGDRAALLDDEGLRRRRQDTDKADTDAGVQGKLSAEDEALMGRHQPVQDDLTANLVDLVGQLKHSVTDNRDRLRADSGVLDAADSAVEASLEAIRRQRDNLAKFTQASSTSWWLIAVGALVIFVVFLFVFMLLKVPI